MGPYRSPFRGTPRGTARGTGGASGALMGALARGLGAFVEGSSTERLDCSGDLLYWCLRSSAWWLGRWETLVKRPAVVVGCRLSGKSSVRPFC